VSRAEGFLMWLGFAIGVYIAMALGFYRTVNFAVRMLVNGWKQR
jgi:hypothetical protein